MIDKATREKALDLGKPLTPKSERLRSTYGSLMVSLQTVRELCPSPKCCRKQGHDGPCWPAP